MSYLVKVAMPLCGWFQLVFDVDVVPDLMVDLAEVWCL